MLKSVNRSVKPKISLPKFMTGIDHPPVIPNLARDTCCSQNAFRHLSFPLLTFLAASSLIFPFPSFVFSLVFLLRLPFHRTNSHDDANTSHKKPQAARRDKPPWTMNTKPTAVLKTNQVICRRDDSTRTNGCRARRLDNGWRG